MAAISTTIGPVLMVVAAHLFLPDEKMTRNKAMGVLLAFSGALFLVLRGESGLAGVGRASALGFTLILVGALAEVANAIFVRRRMQAMDPISVTGVRLLSGALVMMVVALLLGDFSTGDFSAGNITAVGYLSLLYAALIGALAGQFLAFYITGRFGATAFSLTIYLVPVVATTLGVLLLGEIVTWPMLVGVTLIGGGIYLINRPMKAAESEQVLAASATSRLRT